MYYDKKTETNTKGITIFNNLTHSVSKPHCSSMRNPLPRMDSSINPDCRFFLSTSAELDAL